MEKITIFLTLIAGLGLFLYGMRLMSDGLEKVAGTKMKSILNMCTKNRFIGVMVGLGFTAVIQSSSAATVMIVSFVNSGLMTLVQSVGPIMGANIGTTVTGQLVALKLDNVAPLFIFVGVVMIMFMKKPMVKKVGEIIFGFGILFFGMSTMQGSMETLKDSPQIMNTIASLKNPFFAVIVGYVFTAIIQSSSASVGIIMGMAASGMLTDLNIIFYLILGCDIGTCMSAVLASLGAKKVAKRTAVIHLMFNVIGCTIIGILLIPFGGMLVDLITKLSGGMGKAAVANANTIFKIFEVILLFPAAKLLVKIANFIISGEDKKPEGYTLKYINPNVIPNSSAAIIEVQREIKRMGKKSASNLEMGFNAIMNKDKVLIDNVFVVEKEVDFLCSEITKYLVRLTQATLPLKDAKNIAGYFHVVNDLERISDHAENLAEFANTRIQEDIHFSEKGTEELQGMFNKVIATVNLAIETFTEQTEEHLAEIVKLEDNVDKLEKELQNAHVRRLASNECSAKASIYSDIVSNLERVSDHATNIAFAIYDESQYDMDEIED